MGKLDGRVALVTGAASGNGRGIAVRFAQEGADVVVADLNEAGMDETARLVRQQERRATTVRCDVSKLSDIDAAVQAAVREFGRVDIAVANAGVAEKGTHCLAMTEEEWDRTIDVNLKGVFFTLQAAAKQMIAQGGGGRLIAIASIMAELGTPGMPAYCASKAGVKLLVQSFGMQVGPMGITCNAIGPGYIDTAMLRGLTGGPNFAGLIDQTPVGRIGEPEDIGAVAAFLASDDASFVNGTIIFPDGGTTAGHYRASAMAAAGAQRG